MGFSDVLFPDHLTSIDWNNMQHRTAVAACLVEAVYKLQKDLKLNLVGPDSQAKHWWEFLNFSLVQTLINESDKSIYGAIFKYNFFDNYQNIPDFNFPPLYVIAFRGTVIKTQTWFSDGLLDLRCMFHTLHRSTRFNHAIHAIQTTVEKHSDKHVWLAGHSLGAGLALMAGKTMARSRIYLETYIFNPPISSVPLEQLSSCRILKGGINMFGSFFKATLATTFKDPEVQKDDEAKNIILWKPYLYVNPSDPICSEYIGYFKNKSFMTAIGLGRIECIATKNPLRSYLQIIKETFSSPSSSPPSSSLSSSSSSLPSSSLPSSSALPDFSTESLHLLPSAYMAINKNKTSRRNAHGLQQWLDPSFNPEYVLYQFSR